MPAFSSISFSKLATCHVDLQTIFYEVIKHFDCTILEGHRNQEQQDADFEAGRSKLKWPNGKHNSTPSNAVDACFYPVPGWDMIEDFIYFGGMVMGIAAKLKSEGKVSHGLRYGGNWKGDNKPGEQVSLKDYVHFELII
jgi:peptidoglycan L-alanyl-D-glutamate endopeptidase CwlK